MFYIGVNACKSWENIPFSYILPFPSFMFIETRKLANIHRQFRHIWFLCVLPFIWESYVHVYRIIWVSYMYMTKLAVYNIQWKRRGNLNGDRCHVRLLHVNDKYMYIYYNISEIAMHILPTEKNPTVTNNSDNYFKFIQNVDGKNLTQKRLKLWNRFLFIFIHLLRCKDKSIVCTISSQYLLTCIKYGMW